MSGTHAAQDVESERLRWLKLALAASAHRFLSTESADFVGEKYTLLFQQSKAALPAVVSCCKTVWTRWEGTCSARVRLPCQESNVKRLVLQAMPLAGALAVLLH